MTADDVGHTVTTTGSPTISSSSKFGAGALSLNGSSQLTVAPTASEFNLTAAGPWTIECWINPTAVSGVQDIVTGAGFNFSLSGSTLRWDNGQSASSSYYSNAVTAGSFQKVEVTNSGGTIYVFAGGTLLGSAASQSLGTTTRITIGGNSGSYFTGVIDELRISNGIARHTASYTVETTAFAITPSALDLRSAAVALGFTPMKGSLFVIVNPLYGVTITPQTNLIASISQNGTVGTPTYTQMALTLSGTTTKGYLIYEANGVALPGTGQALKVRVQTTFGTGVQVIGVYAKVQ